MHARAGDAGDRAPCVGARRRRLPALSLVLSLVVAAVAARPVAASAAAPADGARARVEALYGEAGEASEAGDHVRAAAAYREVLAAWPEDERSHASRALALADAVAAYRAAYAADPAAGELLCEALATIEAYEEELRTVHGDGAAALDGAQLAADRRATLAAAIADDGLSCETDELEPEPAPAPEPEPAPAPAPAPGPRPGQPPLLLAGVVSSGVGLGLLAVMGAGLLVGARAERAGEILRRAMPGLPIDDPELAAIARRGLRGDRMAIVAGVGAGAALIAGGILIGVVLRRRGSTEAQARPGTLGLGGAGLVLRF